MVKEAGKIVLTAGQFERCLVLNETPALLHNRFGLKTCATFSSNQKKKKNTHPITTPLHMFSRASTQLHTFT